MQHYHQGTVATATTSMFAGLSMLWIAIVNHAPPWTLVPPILLSIASLVTALISFKKYLDGRRDDQARAGQRLRHAEEIHRARLAAIGANGPDFDTLDAR